MAAPANITNTSFDRGLAISDGESTPTYHFISVMSSFTPPSAPDFASVRTAGSRYADPQRKVRDAREMRFTLLHHNSGFAKFIRAKVASQEEVPVFYIDHWTTAEPTDDGAMAVGEVGMVKFQSDGGSDEGGVAASSFIATFQGPTTPLTQASGANLDLINDLPNTIT